LSLFEIAQVINRVGGYDPSLLHGCLRHQAGPIPPRAGDVTMNSSKLANVLGYEPFHPWPHDEHLTPTHREWHHDRGGGIDGSKDLLSKVLYQNQLRRNAAMTI